MGLDRGDRHLVLQVGLVGVEGEGGRPAAAHLEVAARLQVSQHRLEHERVADPEVHVVVAEGETPARLGGARERRVPGEPGELGEELELLMLAEPDPREVRRAAKRRADWASTSSRSGTGE